MADRTEGAPQVAPKPPRGRSPSYPGIPLDIAVERAQRLFDVQRDRASQVDVILSHWRYSSGSGAGLVTLAALKKFGLLVDEGSGKARKAKLTPLGVRFGVDRRPDSPERKAALREAALQPKIHKEIWERYNGNLPDNEALIIYLQMERNFTSHGAREFVEEFRRTISHAELSASDTLRDNGEDIQDAGTPSNDVSQPPGGATPWVDRGVNTLIGPPPDQKSYRIPVDSEEDVIVTFTGPVTPEKWETFMTILDAMKVPILRGRKRDEPEPEDYQE